MAVLPAGPMGVLEPTEASEVAACRITDRRSAAGRAPDALSNRWDRDARPVRCNVWLCDRSVRRHSHCVVHRLADLVLPNDGAVLVRPSQVREDRLDGLAIDFKPKPWQKRLNSLRIAHSRRARLSNVSRRSSGVIQFATPQVA